MKKHFVSTKKDRAIIKKQLLSLLKSKKKCSSLLFFKSFQPTNKAYAFHYNWYEQNAWITDEYIKFLLKNI